MTLPRGADTSTHQQRPSVARPGCTSRWRHSRASRSTGVADPASPEMRVVGSASHTMPRTWVVVGLAFSPGSIRANDGVMRLSCFLMGDHLGDGLRERHSFGDAAAFDSVR